MVDADVFSKSDPMVVVEQQVSLFYFFILYESYSFIPYLCTMDRYNSVGMTFSRMHSNYLLFSILSHTLVSHFLCEFIIIQETIIINYVTADVI